MLHEAILNGSKLGDMAREMGISVSKLSLAMKDWRDRYDEEVPTFRMPLAHEIGKPEDINKSNIPRSQR